MPSLFKHISQIQTRADYDKLLRKALAPDSATEGVGPTEEFHYFEDFPFDKKPGTLLLVGDIGKALLGELKKLGNGYARGTCRMTPNKRVLVDIETGKVKPKLINGALKTSGLKLQAVVNGEEPEPDPELSDAAAESPPQDAPPKPKAPPSPEQQQWMDKVKVLRPAFDKALQLARSTDPRWAEDLDSNFAQMMQEARAGDFKEAMETLKRLAVILRSREAARAEVKQQTQMEDPEFAEGVRQQREVQDEFYRENPSMRDDQAAGLETAGFGLTSDGTSMYVRAITADEWKAGVSEPLKSLTLLLKDTRQRDMRFDTLAARLGPLSDMLDKVYRLSQEEDRPELQGAGLRLTGLSSDLVQAVQHLAPPPGMPKPQPENMLVVLAELDDTLRGLMLAKSQEVLEVRRSSTTGESPEQTQQRREAERSETEQLKAMDENLLELSRRAYKLSEELRVLRQWKRPSGMKDDEFERQKQAHAERIEDIEEDLAQLEKAQQRMEHSLELARNNGRPSDYQEVGESLDFEALKRAFDVWNQQFKPLKQHIRDGQWRDAQQIIGDINEAIVRPLAEQSENIPKGIERIVREMSELESLLQLALMASQTSPAAALDLLKKLILACAEFQRLYFK